MALTDEGVVVEVANREEGYFKGSDLGGLNCNLIAVHQHRSPFSCASGEARTGGGESTWGPCESRWSRGMKVHDLGSRVEIKDKEGLKGLHSRRSVRRRKRRSDITCGKKKTICTSWIGVTEKGLLMLLPAEQQVRERASFLEQKKGTFPQACTFSTLGKVRPRAARTLWIT